MDPVRQYACHVDPRRRTPDKARDDDHPAPGKTGKSDNSDREIPLPLVLSVADV